MCRNAAGQAICEGAVLHHCGATGMTESSETCMSEAHCRAGMSSGVCGVCAPGDARCEGAELQSCNASGVFEQMDTCDSVALCSADQHICMNKGCATGAFDCIGDMLSQCKPDLTGFMPLKSCAAGLCDRAGGKCLDCTPSKVSCESNTSVVCSAAGTGPSRTPCSGGTPQCDAGSGKCVACLTNSDCKGGNECTPQICNTSSNTCVAGTFTKAHASCGGTKVCDGRGSCVGCSDDTDCAASNPKSACSGSQCVNKPGFEQFSGSGGNYTVKLNAGYRLDITALDYETSIDGTITVSAGGTTRTFTTQNHPNASIPAADMARTVTIRGPDLSPQTCGAKNSSSASSIVLHFEDYDVNSPDADCNEPILQLTAQ